MTFSGNFWNMLPGTFINIRDMFSSRGLLASSRNVSIDEKLGTFLFIVGHGASNCNVQERFQRSGFTILKYMLTIV